MHNHSSTLEEAPVSLVKSSTSAEQEVRNNNLVKKKNRMSHSFQICSNAFHNLTASLSNIRLSSSTSSSSGTNGQTSTGGKKKCSSLRKTNSNASDSDHFYNGHQQQHHQFVHSDEISNLVKREKRDSTNSTGNSFTSSKVGKEYTCCDLGDACNHQLNHSRVKCYSVYDDTFASTEDGVIDVDTSTNTIGIGKYHHHHHSHHSNHHHYHQQQQHHHHSHHKRNSCFFSHHLPISRSQVAISENV